MKCLVPISGGKDSQACVKLAVDYFGREKVEGLFCDTKFEHPVTYAHVDNIRKMYGINIHKICAGSVPLQVKRWKRFPGGGARFCTKYLKIEPSKRFYLDYVRAEGPIEVWYGLRTGESFVRKQRYRNKVADEIYAPHEVITNYPKKLYESGVVFRLPILRWTSEEVLSFLEGEENILYNLGFDRVGCFPCLAAGDKHKEKAFTFDVHGKKHFKIVRELEHSTGKRVFTSKSGLLKDDLREKENQDDSYSGCAFCAI